MPYDRGSVWHKSRSTENMAYRPKNVACETPPPPFMPYEPFLLGVGVVFNLLNCPPRKIIQIPAFLGSHKNHEMQFSVTTPASTLTPFGASKDNGCLELGDRIYAHTHRETSGTQTFWSTLRGVGHPPDIPIKKFCFPGIRRRKCTFRPPLREDSHPNKCGRLIFFTTTGADASGAQHR